MIELLLTIILYLIIGGLIWYLVGLLPFNGKIKQAIQVCFIIIAIFLLLGLILGEVPLVSIHR